MSHAPWLPVSVSDYRLLGLRDRHYTCKSPGAATAGPPGQRVAFVTFEGTAGWISHRPRPEYVRHAFGFGDVCTLFRNEGAGLSSELIEAAIGLTESDWLPSPHGWLTMIDPEAVRRKRDPGRCFRRVGFEPVGYTKERHYLVLARPFERFRVKPLPNPRLPRERGKVAGVNGLTTPGEEVRRET